MESSSWHSQLVVLTIVGGIWAFSIWRFIRQVQKLNSIFFFFWLYTIDRVFSEWLIPEPCEPFLPIPEFQRNALVICNLWMLLLDSECLFSQCLDPNKRSPKFVRQPVRWRHNSQGFQKSDLLEGNGQGPLFPCGQTCRAAKSPSLPVIPRPSSRRRQNTASR